MNRCFIGCCIAAALLAACGESQVSSPVPAHLTNAALHPPVSDGYEVLHSFKGSPRDGNGPTGYLTALNGVLYGTTSSGGAHGAGTVFEISTSGQERVLYSFRGHRDGANPDGGLIAVDGVLYGTTFAGGTPCGESEGCGTVYAVSTSGDERVLYRFTGAPDGGQPIRGLTAMNGELYGVTWVGGLTRACKDFASEGCGTVFAISISGDERVLYRFKGGKDGAIPEGDLLRLRGRLFGTTFFGGNFGRKSECPLEGCGTIFAVSAAGVESVVYRFQGGSDGAGPAAGLIDLKGLLYGTTSEGGSGCTPGGCGTVFNASTSGNESVVYRFKGAPDGASPLSRLVSVNGKLYGTTLSGGNVCIGGGSGYDAGTLFDLSTSGHERQVYLFNCKSGGDIPGASLLPLEDALYGTTSWGGGRDLGTVFTVSL